MVCRYMYINNINVMVLTACKFIVLIIKCSHGVCILTNKHLFFNGHNSLGGVTMVTRKYKYKLNQIISPQMMYSS